MQDPFKNTSTWPLLAHPNVHSKHGKETHLGKRHFLTLVSVGLGAGPRISTKISKKGVFVKHPSKKVVSFWCWCEGQLKPTVRVFFPPRTPNDWPIGTRLPQNLTLIKSCCSSSANIMATDLMGNQVVFFLLNAHCVTHHHSPRLRWCARPAGQQTAAEASFLASPLQQSLLPFCYLRL